MSGSKRIKPPVSHKLFAMLQLFEMLDAVRHCSFSARLDCHYLVRAPEAAGPRTLLFVTLHGFGQTPEIILPLTANLVGDQHVVALTHGVETAVTRAFAQVLPDHAVADPPGRWCGDHIGSPGRDHAVRGSVTRRA